MRVEVIVNQLYLQVFKTSYYNTFDVSSVLSDEVVL